MIYSVIIYLDTSISTVNISRPIVTPCMERRGREPRSTCAGSRSTGLSWRVLWRWTCAATCGARDVSAAAGGPRTEC